MCSSTFFFPRKFGTENQTPDPLIELKTNSNWISMLEVFIRVAERAQYKTKRAIRQKYRGRQTSFSFDSFETSEGKIRLFLNPVVKLRTSLYWTSMLRASVQSLRNELEWVADKRMRKVNKNIRKIRSFKQKKSNTLHYHIYF